MSNMRLIKIDDSGSSVVQAPHVKRAVVSLVKRAGTGEPFQIASGGFFGQPDFALMTGRRGPETRGLNTGPATTSILNGIVARQRSRFAVLASPFAKRSVDILVSNVVGSGFSLISEAPDKEFKRKVESLWQKWGLVADTTGQLSFAGLTSLAYRSCIEGGDCFSRFRNRRAVDNLPVPLQLQLIESEQVPLFKNEKKGAHNIIAGIQFDVTGKPVIYHMFPNHPGDFLTVEGVAAETVAVPASEILHIHEVRRPSDVRGMPALSQMLIRLSDFDRYMDSEMMRKKAAALIGGFITEPHDSQDLNPMITGLSDNNQEEVVIEAFEPASFGILPPGFDVKFSNPADVGANFEVFLKWQLRTVASSMNLTFEQLTGDLTDVTDRTLRATLLEFKRIITATQKNIIVFQFCQPVFDRFFDTAIISGALDIPAGLSEEDARKVRWIADPWKHLHPQQEIIAETMEVRGGFKTRSESLIERGKDPDEVDNRFAEDKERQSNLDLVFDTDVEEVSRAGVAHSVERLTKAFDTDDMEEETDDES